VLVVYRTSKILKKILGNMNIKCILLEINRVLCAEYVIKFKKIVNRSEPCLFDIRVVFASTV